MSQLQGEIPPVVLGVDVGSTKILVGYVEEDGTVCRSQCYPMNRRNQQAAVAAVTSAVGDFLGQPWAGGAPLAFGMGLVGQTDLAGRTWIQCMNIPVRRPVPIADLMAERHGLGGRIDNDVHAATLAELRLGAGRQTDDFIYLNLGTGIAAGLVCGGRLVRGASNYAGEIGHQVVEPDGAPCDCGRRGCLEPLASGGGVIARVREALGDARSATGPSSVLQELSVQGRLSFSTVCQAARNGDSLAERIADRALRALGIALVNLINLLNPRLVVLGGGAVEDRLIAHLAQWVEREALPAARAALEGIVPSPLKPDWVGLIGAACLAWDHLRDQERSRDPCG
jgi:glucokinase